MKKIKPAHWAIGGALAVSLGLGGVLTMANAGGAGQASTLVPITPCRLVDTRADQTVGTRNTALSAGEVADFAVWGTNGNCTIPSNATGIASNVTSVNGTSASYLTVYPGDATRPLSSNLNWTAASAPTPNQVTVGLSATGGIKAFNNAGTVDVVIDIVGYYVASVGGAQGPAGPAGPAGASLLNSKIPSGTTITGYEAFTWTGVQSGQHDEVVHLPAKAPAALTDALVNFANTFTVNTPENDTTCTGTFAAPTAPAGHVCLYVDKNSVQNKFFGYGVTPAFADTAFLIIMSENPGSNYASMSWAYTAP